MIHAAADGYSSSLPSPSPVVSRMNATSASTAWCNFRPPLGKWLIVWLSLGLALSFHRSPASIADELPWEFDPYRFRLWLSVDPSLDLGEEEHRRLLVAVSQQLELVYQATANVEAETTPRSLFSSIMRDLDQLDIPQILEKEFILVVARNHPEAKEIRTLESLTQQLSQIEASPSTYEELQRELEPYTAEASWKAISGKLVRAPDTHREFMKRLDEGQVVAAFIRRSELPSLGRSVRYIPARFPWQLDALLRSYDKIFAVSLRRESEIYRLQVREIDAVMRVVGPIVKAEAVVWEAVPRAIAFASHQAFAPVARIEEADLKLAALRIRAGGLINQDQHPAAFSPGDVLQPYVRRDDRNGIPTLLQNIPWTYVAITSSDGIEATGAIYTGIRSPLAGRKNRRTQKICLRVRLQAPSTDLQLGLVRDPGTRLAGAEIYRRTPGLEDLAPVGRSDWRGIAAINILEPPLAAYEVPISGETAAVAPSGLTSATLAAGAEPPTKPTPYRKESIQLRAPLYIYYVKHGNTLLARLPMVTGNATLEKAELPDDRRRLEAEAFVKGVQGEILDVVARRQILAARIKQYAAENKIDQAKQTLEELRNEKGFDQMVESLNAIQRRILSSDRGTIPSLAQKRIDQMFDLTRQMMQRYLQDSLLRDMQVTVGKLSAK
jgi:hypothetical protein